MSYPVIDHPGTVVDVITFSHGDRRYLNTKNIHAYDYFTEGRRWLEISFYKYQQCLTDPSCLQGNSISHSRSIWIHNK